jgi:hypothetical protein
VVLFRRRGTAIQDDALAFNDLLRKCFVALGEEDARKAIDQQWADLRLAANCACRMESFL